MQALDLEQESPLNMKNMHERRKEKREKMTAFTPVYDEHPRTLLGYLADLTLMGVMVTGEKPLKVNKSGILAIEFPDKLEISPSRITIPARVARCVPDETNPQYYNIGFEFTEVKPEQEKVIKAILRRYRF